MAASSPAPGHVEPDRAARRPGYLDAVGARPLSVTARNALAAGFSEGWADPDRGHHEGRRARLLLDAARQAYADVLGCHPDELRFVPSRGDAVRAAVDGVRAGRRRVGATVVHSAVEHSSVISAAGRDATSVTVDAMGRVDPGAWRAGVAQPGVALAALQAANAEVGTRQPLTAAVEAARAAGVPLLVDASHTLGSGPVPDRWDLLVADAQTWGAPGGVNVLGIRRGVRWPEQPACRVPVPLIVASAAALEESVASASARAARATRQIERIRAEVPRRIADVAVLGDPVDRLPHVVTFSCLYVDGEALVTALDRAGFGVASGSACATDEVRAAGPSHVLAAMGALTHGNIRLSVLPDTTDDTIESFLAALPPIVAELRARAGAGSL